jgi:hypothetical protein
MFGFGNSKKSKIVKAFKNQGIGGQSVIYKLFVQALAVKSAEVRRIELTYFSLTLISYVFLRFYNGPEKKDVLDEMSLSILETSIRGCGEKISIKEAIAEYQKRYQEYNALLEPLFSKTDVDPNITLLMHLYESVVQKSAKDAMIQISTVSPLIHQFVLDHIDFVQTEPWD